MAKTVETRTQLLRRASQKAASKIQGDIRPYFGAVQEYNADQDTTLVDSHGGRRVLFNPQPHLGRTAWMRAAPEGGMGSIMITRSDTNAPELMRWWHTDTGLRLALFRENVDAISNGDGQLVSKEAFRPLQSGEIDIVSRGGSQLFLGGRPHTDMRAGIIRFTMDQDEAESSHKAPLHIRKGYQHTSNEIRDEERFGVVKRSTSYNKSFYVDPDGNRDDSREGRGFAKEHLVRMANPQLAAPSTLLDVRSGHAMDDQGQPYKLNGEKLRVRAEYFTTSDTSVLLQLDELGNFSIEHPNEATTGGRFVMPRGSIEAEIGVDLKEIIGRNREIFIGTDKSETIGHSETVLIRNSRNTTIMADEVKVVGINADETVGTNKSIRVGGVFSIQTGTSTAAVSKLNFTDAASAFETDTLTILARREIILEAPSITFNSPVVNFTGNIRTNGFQCNSTTIAPNGARGSAGPIANRPAIRV